MRRVYDTKPMPYPKTRIGLIAVGFVVLAAVGLLIGFTVGMITFVG